MIVIENDVGKQSVMFSKGKSALKLLENNPILSHYEVGRLYANGGPEGVWKIYEGVSKTDGKVESTRNYKVGLSRNTIIYFAGSFHLRI